MSESTLLVVFIAFAVLFLLGAGILRKLSVRDIFDNIPLSSEAGISTSMDKSPYSAKGTKTLGEKSAFKLDRKAINNIGKILVTIGAIMLFAPLPDSFTTYGMGIAFLGYLIVKATAPPKKKKSSVSQNPTAQKIRQLASRSEYQEAAKLLMSDLKNKSLVSEEDKYRRSINYLQNKGVSAAEAKENLQLLITLLNRQRK